MADGIGPLMHPMQASGRHALVDHLDVKPEFLQLPKRHHPELPPRQPGDSPVNPDLLPTGRFPSI
ncbi:MAG TPA: hypothetical protein VNC16_02860 [Solirubrobacterales bacterium]|jgi:hypothetical protein|nr:hypothetical protein [Solirubrobacterales bacterium]